MVLDSSCVLGEFVFDFVLSGLVLGSRAQVIGSRVPPVKVNIERKALLTSLLNPPLPPRPFSLFLSYTMGSQWHWNGVSFSSWRHLAELRGRCQGHNKRRLRSNVEVANQYLRNADR